MRKAHKEIALFIPCFNEEKRLKIKPLQAFFEKNKSFIDIYFVDDGSRDGTVQLLEENFIEKKNVFLLKLFKNQGKGNALREGILNTRNKDYEFYGFIDADMDIPLEQILKLYKEIKDSSNLMAISNRNLFTKIKLTRLRSFSSIAMVFIANKVINIKPRLRDTQCGCKLFKREILQTCFKEKFISEWLFDIELFLRLKKHLPEARNFIIEVPLLEMGKTENSNFKFLQNLKLIRQLYLIHTHYNK